MFRDGQVNLIEFPMVVGRGRILCLLMILHVFVGSWLCRGQMRGLWQAQVICRLVWFREVEDLLGCSRFSGKSVKTLICSRHNRNWMQATCRPRWIDQDEQKIGRRSDFRDFGVTDVLRKLGQNMGFGSQFLSCLMDVSSLVERVGDLPLGCLRLLSKKW